MAKQGVITHVEREFVETWRHVSAAQHGIIRLNARGEEVHELIAGDREFMCTTEDRIVTQMRIRHEKNDPFLNGAFRPVVVPDSVTPKSNPNAISDDEMRSILVSSSVAWDEWMKSIDSPDTIQRMIDLAPETDTTVKRLTLLQDRLAELRPQTRITQKDMDEYASIGAAPPSSGPASAARPMRGPRRRAAQSGRSENYR